MAYLSFFVLAFILVFVNGVYIAPSQLSGAEGGIAIPDNFVKQVDVLQDVRDPKSEVQDVYPLKEYLQDLLHNLNVDSDALKAKLLAASDARSKREVREEPVDPLVAIIDGILGAIASTLKSLVDSFLVTFNNHTSGVFREVLLMIQSLAFEIIDARFPSTTISYNSNLRL